MDLLEDPGYRVLLAENGPAALTTLKQHREVDLLFTDVVMPQGMSGPQLVDEALSRYPKLKVLYTSGYSQNALSEYGKLNQDVEWVAKPYSNQALAKKVRQVLDKPQDQQ